MASLRGMGSSGNSLRSSLGRGMNMRNGERVMAMERKRKAELAERQAKYDARYQARMDKLAARRAEIVNAREERAGELDAKRFGDYVKKERKLNQQTQRESLKQRKRMSKELAKQKVDKLKQEAQRRERVEALRRAENLKKMTRRSIEFSLNKILDKINSDLKPYFRASNDGYIKQRLNNMVAEVSIEIESALEDVKQHVAETIRDKYNEIQGTLIDDATYIVEIYDLDDATVEDIIWDTLVEYTEGRITARSVESTMLRRAEIESRRVN